MTLTHQLHGRAIEAQQCLFINAGERVDEQRRPDAAKIQHHRRLLSRARCFDRGFDGRLRIVA